MKRLQIRSYDETRIRMTAQSTVGLVVNNHVSFDKPKQEDKVIFRFSLTHSYRRFI